MKIPRRRFLQLATGAAALPAVSRVASAQAYPARTVRWIETRRRAQTQIVDLSRGFDSSEF